MTRTLRWAVACIEILGGLVGVGSMLPQLFGPEGPKGAFGVAVFAAFLVLFSLSALGGWLLLFRSREMGLRISLVVQALQIPWFTLSGLTYGFASGLYVLAGFGSARPQFSAFDLVLGSEFRVQLHGEPGTSFHVNLVALCLFLVLLGSRRSERRPA